MGESELRLHPCRSEIESLKHYETFVELPYEIKPLRVDG